MGLASSQARMLLLTARKSDLEYRAQMISQRKINLAMQTQELATNYSNSMSNRKMDFVFNVGDNDVRTENLSYSGLTAENGYNIGNYLVTTANGKYVYSGRTQDEMLDDAYKVMNRLITSDPNKFKDYIQVVDDVDENGKVKTDANGNAVKKTTYDYQAIAKDYLTCIPQVMNDSYFQDALRNGGLFLQTIDTNADGSTNGQYHEISWSSVGAIRDVLDTSDDAQAQANYEAKSIVLSNQDKMLDLELNQIETQHKAIETEYDSVKKVIQKNIEVSYKIFA